MRKDDINPISKANASIAIYEKCVDEVLELIANEGMAIIEVLDSDELGTSKDEDYASSLMVRLINLRITLKVFKRLIPRRYNKFADLADLQKIVLYKDDRFWRTFGKRVKRNQKRR